MTDEYNAAEEIDEQLLKQGSGTGDLPALDEFVDGGPMSSEDPSVLLGSTEAADSDAIRDWREEPDVSANARPVEPRYDATLLLDDADVSSLDDEEELLGETVRSEVEDGRVGPEDRAMHIESER